MNKKLARLQSDANQAIQLNCMKEGTKSRFEVIVTSYGRNTNLDETKKNPKQANNSLSYRFVAINQKR